MWFFLLLRMLTGKESSALSNGEIETVSLQEKVRDDSRVNSNSSREKGNELQDMSLVEFLPVPHSSLQPPHNEGR